MTSLHIFLGLAALGMLGTACVLWHARKRLKLSKDAIRDTDFPNASGG